MTQQYLAGEVSALLGELQSVAGKQTTATEIAHLRHHAETMPIPALAAVAARAFEVIDAECWDAVDRGDTAALDTQAGLGARLLDFAICAGLRLDLPA